MCKGCLEGPKKKKENENCLNLRIESVAFSLQTRCHNFTFMFHFIVPSLCSDVYIPNPFLYTLFSFNSRSSLVAVRCLNVVSAKLLSTSGPCLSILFQTQNGDLACPQNVVLCLPFTFYYFYKLPKHQTTDESHDAK